MSKPIICLNAGHFAKYNQSPANPAYWESEVMWKYHLMKKAYLEQHGFEVRLTRNEQIKDMDIVARGMAAGGCVAYISDHSDAAENDVADFVSAYHLTSDNATNADEISKALAEKLAPVIANVMGTKQGYKVLTRQSGRDRNNDGVMNDNYYGELHGSRLANVPGIILEHSFHTNPRSTNWLLNDSNLDRLARAEADVIAEYFGMTGEADPVPDSGKLWRVQVGAFKQNKRAAEHEKKIRAAGFDTYMILADGYYKIQIGAYYDRENADAMLERIKAAGFDTYITDRGGTAVSAEIVQKPNEVIAKEVIKGIWGNGLARKQALESAGYDFTVIQKLVNKMAG